MSSAKITIWENTVGYLTWDDRTQTAIFEAEKSYINSPLNIAPILHRDKEEMIFGNNFSDKFQGMIPTFNDSLPDSFGNIIFKEWLEQVDLNQSDMNPVERLLYVGKRGVGALEYLVGKEIPNLTQNIDLEELSNISDTILKKKYNQNDFLNNPEALQNILTIGSSVGGAQAKILVAITQDDSLLAGDVLHEYPAEYYIVKLEHNSQDKWCQEKNFVEYVYNSIAKDIGINVAPSRLLTEGGRTHFASKRFDRQIDVKTGAIRKIHQQTVNALAGFFGKNYEFGYEDIFKIMEFLKLPYADKEQLFSQMVFNIVSGNRDDHTKNFSFVMNDLGQWSYSPAYDLTYPFDPYQSFYVPHQISINSKVKNISYQDILDVSKKVGILGAKAIIENVLDHINSFSHKIKQFDLNDKTVQLINKEISRNISNLKR